MRLVGTDGWLATRTGVNDGVGSAAVARANHCTGTRRTIVAAMWDGRRAALMMRGKLCGMDEIAEGHAA